jgi:ThiF family
MSETLISLNPDLAKLEAAGLHLRIIEGKSAMHLIVEGICAANSKREIITGALYTPLEMDQNRKTRNPVPNHQCWWIGSEPPCDPTGAVMDEFMSNKTPEDKGDGITTLVGFSMKWKQDGVMVSYPDYYEKIRSYIAPIWAAASAIDNTCSPYSNKPVAAVVETQERVFHYPDMATTRAGIGAATAKLLVQRVAIIGMGGTGSYILDLLAKVPIGEIHLYDGDVFQLHNAFRAPGAPRKEELTEPKKVDWFSSIYSRMHKGIVPHAYNVTEANIDELAGFTFVFVAVDDPKARKGILHGLIARGVPFIDVGMDMELNKANSLMGMCRYTVGLPDFNAHVAQVVSFDDGPENNIYRNIQVADMNMQIASMAVMKWKKLLGFYADSKQEHHGLYNIETGSLIKEDFR